MKRKLSKKESNEVVTKGYLSEALDVYVTKESLDKKFEDFCSKDYVNKRLEYYATKGLLDERMTTFAEVIMEEFRSQTKMIIEYLQIVIERYDRSHEEFERQFAQKDVWLNNHEFRIFKLEGRKS